jgi:arylsulfatase A-like enzyme
LHHHFRPAKIRKANAYPYLESEENASMNRTPLTLGFLVAAVAVSGLARPAEPPKQPNLVFILADDLGYGDLSCYGQSKFKTPHIDKLAANGLRFTQAYAGSTVCSPSRCVLQTGRNTGHSRIRGNGCDVGGIAKFGRRRMHLLPEDTTVGHVMQKAGYRTCLIGKWHLGGYSPEGSPWNQGYDEFYGWLSITRGQHNPIYFPEKYYENQKLIPVDKTENRGGYQTDLNTGYAVKFIATSKEKPFLLMVNYVLPHSPYSVPNVDDFEDQPKWDKNQKTYAQMVANLDAAVGRIMATLDKLGLTKNTLVIFSSDNGPRSEPAGFQTKTVNFFDSNGALRGYKRDMYEGGIRVPMIAHWPGHVPEGKTSDAVWYFADLLPTAADLAGAAPPEDIDGISVLPVLLGRQDKLPDRFLYWEFFERGFQQAVRWGDWKAVRLRRGGPLELYDLSVDIGEEQNVASSHPGVIARIEEYLKTARSESPNWPLTQR